MRSKSTRLCQPAQGSGQMRAAFANGAGAGHRRFSNQERSQAGLGALGEAAAN